MGRRLVPVELRPGPRHHGQRRPQTDEATVGFVVFEAHGVRDADASEGETLLLREIRNGFGETVAQRMATFSGRGCCGGGGGRMWMEEKIGTRINLNRVDEAISTGAEEVAVACPFCMTMLRDGVKQKEQESTMEVLDLAELVVRQNG